MHCKKKISFLLSLMFIIGACAGIEKPRNKIDFYTLEYDPPMQAGLSPLPVVIRLQRFSVAPDYNTNRIIYRDRSFRRNSYVYHKWRANPGDLVAHFLGRDMIRSGLFKAVLAHDSGSSASYLLEGSINEFLERDLDERWEAVLSLDITLMRGNEPDASKRILFQKTYREDEPCRRRNPRALAEAMSGAMAEISKKIIEDVYAETRHNGKHNPNNH